MINFLKKFFNPNFNSKSDKMLNFGVFVRSHSSNDVLAKSCRKLIKKIQMNTNIVTMSTCSEYGGLKVFFDSESSLLPILRKQFLLTSNNERSTIHRLKTHLKVHDAIYDEQQFKENAVKELTKLGLEPILEIHQIPFSEEAPEIGSGNWKIILDVPEVEELELFRRNGFPEQMTLKLPQSNNSFRVTFCCCICGEDGHTSSKCSPSNRKPATPIKIGTKQTNHDAKKPDELQSSRRTVTSSHASSTQRSSLNSTTFSSSDIGEIGSVIKSEFMRGCSEVAASKNLPGRESIEEIEESIGKKIVSDYSNAFPFSSYGLKSAKKRLLENPIGGLSSKKHCYSTFAGSNSPKDHSADLDSSKDEVILIDEFPSCSSSICQEGLLTSPFKALITPGFRGNPSEDSGTVTTSNLPISVKPELTSSEDDDSDSSGRTTLAAGSRPRGRPRDRPTRNKPVVIPDSIKCIIEANPGLYGLQQLQVYFSHFKKKSKLTKFAKKMSCDVDALTKQLKKISEVYYSSPKSGGKEETEFMSWFDGLIVRFQGK